MKSDVCLYGGPLFDGRDLMPEAAVRFDADGIITVTPSAEPRQAAHAIDVRGHLIVPGLIDLHCDAIEKCIEMRPRALFNAEFALQALDQRLATCGITTFCHALSFADNELGLRAPEEAETLVALIRAFDRESRGSIKHRVHARFEIGSARSAGIIERLIDTGQVDLLSFMDHTPGQGQFKTLQSYIDFYRRSYEVPADEVLAMVDRKKDNRPRAWEQARKLAASAHAAGIPILSHDDDTPEKIALIQRLNVGGSEFPISMHAAQAARDAGLHIFMGAPNLVRGTSTNGHLKAADTVSQGLCQGLISDYYPECLLQTPFLADARLTVGLPQALRLVTAGPGAFLQDGFAAGCLRPGARADMIVIDTRPRWKKVVQTWVNGRCVYRAEQGLALGVGTPATAMSSAGR